MQGIFLCFNLTLSEKKRRKTYTVIRQVVGFYGGLWLLRSGQLLNSDKVYYAKG